MSQGKNMTRRIKVLQLISTLSVGGAERLLLGLAERIDRERFDIHICALSVSRGNALQSAFENLNLPVYVVGARHFYDPQAFVSVLRYIRKNKIDIVHTHLTPADVTGRLAGTLLRRPVVSTLQNEPRDYDRQRWDQRLLQKITARFLSPELIAVSDRIQTLFVEEWKLPARRMQTIYNAVPMEAYLAISPEPPIHADSQGPVIVNIGRMSPQKAQHHLLNAAKHVLKHRPDVRFMLVGQGRLASELRDQAQALGISGQVIFAGLQKDIPAVLAKSDIFVLSSLWEGLPLTAVEAMAAARPVVLTDVGGNRDLVEHGVQGLIVPPGDERALAEALLTLLKDKSRRHAMGRAARSRVQYDFNIDVVADKHEKLYESIVRRRSSLSEHSVRLRVDP
jgi:glycosyltransferase involved in cell wall biosynthesis